MIKLFFTQVGISASSKVMGCVAPGSGTCLPVCFPAVCDREPLSSLLARARAGSLLNKHHSSFPTHEQEETEYVELLAAEKHQVEALKHTQHRNKSLSLLDEILEDVRRAADRLELEIEEHAFDDNKSVSGCRAPCRGVRLRRLTRMCWHRLETQAEGQHCAPERALCGPADVHWSPCLAIVAPPHPCPSWPICLLPDRILEAFLSLSLWDT